MWKVYISRWVNFYLLRGRRDQMVSSRAYVEHHVWAEKLINQIFLTLRGEKNHCRTTYLWEKRYEANKKATRQPQEASGSQQEETGFLEAEAEGGA